MLQDRPSPPALGAPDEFDPTDHDILGVLVLKTEKRPVGSGLRARRISATAGCGKAVTCQLSGDRLVDRVVERCAWAGEGMRGGDDQRIGHLAVMPECAPAGRSPDERLPGPAGVGRDSGECLKIAQAQRGDRPVIRPDDGGLGGSRHKIEQRLVERHVGGAIVRLVRQDPAGNHGKAHPGAGKAASRSSRKIMVQIKVAKRSTQEGKQRQP